jgi:uncharacterized membrane protein YbhN (UPF0104 family)
MYKRRDRLVFVLKLGVSLGLLIYLALLVDWQQAARTLQKAAKLPILVVPFVSLAGVGLSSLRWRLILADSRVKFSGWQAFRGYLLGLFYGNLLPGVLGGDAVRMGLCVQRTKCPVGTAAGSVLLERIVGLVALFGVAFLVYLAFPAIALPLLPIADTRLIAAGAVAGILGIAVVLAGRRVWLRWLPKESARGLWSFVRTVMLTLGTLKVRTLGLVLILSAMSQAADIVATFLLARAINLHVPLTVFFGVVPLVYLATILPISLGGLGVREGAFTFLLSRFGVPTADAVTLSFLIYVNRLAIGGMGGGLQLMETLSGTWGWKEVLCRKFYHR